MANIKEQNEYRSFTAPAELHKAINTLRGLVAGISTDQQISTEEIAELSHWCVCHAHLIGKHPFSELIPLIEQVYSDGIVTEEEAADILWICNNFVSNSDYYDIITSSIQFLSGLIHGIMSDNEINEQEIHMLQKWLNANDYLSGTYPFDEIESLIMTVLLDGKITDEEKEILKAYFSNFVDTKRSYNLSEPELMAMRDKYSIGGICSICQEIDFDNTVFCFTGASLKASRKEIAELIEKLGGTYKNTVTKKTQYLIVGNQGNPCWAFSCYGRKIEDAIKLRQAGQKLIIVNETDFWDIIEDL